MSHRTGNARVARNLRFGSRTCQVDQNAHRRVKLSADQQPTSGYLADRLFAEYDERSQLRAASRAIGSPSNFSLEFFDNKLATVFSTNTRETGKLTSWLEDYFALEAIVVRETSFFHEWLYRCADVSDVLFIDTDSFSDDGSTNMFLRLVHEICGDTPVFEICSRRRDVRKVPSETRANCDRTLTLPIMLDDFCDAMKEAANIIVHGRTKETSGDPATGTV